MTTALSKSLHKAAAISIKTRRVMWLIRDLQGVVHCLRNPKLKGNLICLLAVDAAGKAVVVRHP